jgi:serine/threonine-protein kinase
VAYLSPEQVERGIADARSDVYAAGLILFEMLTGAKAFTGDTPIHIAYQHVHGSVPAPSSRIASVPPELDALVASATARDPDLRPADANALLAEVRRARAMLTPTELDRRPEGYAGPEGGVSTVAVERTSALPTDQPPAAPASRFGPVALPVDHTPTRPASDELLPLDRQDDSGGGSRRWIWAAVAVALVAGFAAWWFLGGPGSSTVVPRTTNLAYSKAVAALDSAHLGAHRIDQFDESVAKGLVISTNPGAGAEVSRGTDVNVTVSKGPERYAVPNVLNKSKAEATDQITASRLTLGSASEDFSETVPAGLVISVDPKVGTELHRGDKVDIVVSKGRKPIAVQDFTGKPADQAVTALTDAGLAVDATQQQNSDTVPKGSVISQSPAGGTLYQGDKVTLVVSKGPVMVKVPDVSGKQADEAEQILKAAGFVVKRENALGGIFGTVHHTDPAGGTEAPKGSTVTMVVV